MTREQAWDRLSTIVTDEVIDTLLPQGTWDELPDVIGAWFGGLAQGVILPVPADPAADDRFAEVIAAVRTVR